MKLKGRERRGEGPSETFTKNQISMNRRLMKISRFHL